MLLSSSSDFFYVIIFFNSRISTWSFILICLLMTLTIDDTLILSFFCSSYLISFSSLNLFKQLTQSLCQLKRHWFSSGIFSLIVFFSLCMDRIFLLPCLVCFIGNYTFKMINVAILEIRSPP